MRLSTAKIQNATAQKKAVRLFDGRGRYLEIAPTGSRWWRFKYRFAGKEKRISLGVYPDVGLKKARDRRDEMRKLVADGIDPSAARKLQKLMALDAAANTFEAVAREWFEKHSASWETSYSVKLLARLEANIFPWLGDRPIRDIKPPELLSVLRRVESRGVLETAHRLMNYCGNIYRYAVTTGRAEPNATFRRICAAHCRPARRNTMHPSLTLRASPRCYAPSTDIAVHRRRATCRRMIRRALLRPPGALIGQTSRAISATWRRIGRTSVPIAPTSRKTARPSAPTRPTCVATTRRSNAPA